MMEWIATHRVGVSSRTMWAGLMGVTAKPEDPVTRFGYPLDVDDFSRCHDLVKFCEVDPTGDFPKMVETIPWLAPLAREWDTLAGMYERNEKSGLFRRLLRLRREMDMLKRESDGED